VESCSGLRLLSDERGAPLWSLHQASERARGSTIRGSIVVSISARHAEDPGSIPGRGVSPTSKGPPVECQPLAEETAGNPPR
jgi:hypothetical protein